MVRHAILFAALLAGTATLRVSAQAVAPAPTKPAAIPAPAKPTTAPAPAKTAPAPAAKPVATPAPAKTAAGPAPKTVAAPAPAKVAAPVVPAKAPVKMAGSPVAPATAPADTARVVAQADTVHVLTPAQVAEQAYQAGLTSFRNKDFAAALTSFTAAIAAKDDFAPPYGSRAATHFELKAYDLAVADYGQALKLEPANYTAYLGRAAVHEAQGKPAEAEKDYTEALKGGAGFGPA